MNMKITKAFVLLSATQADTVILTTDLPSPMPGVTSEPLSLMFCAEQNTGVPFVRENFGIEPEVRSRE